MERYKVTISLSTRGSAVDATELVVHAMSRGHVDLVRTKLRQAGFKISSPSRLPDDFAARDAKNVASGKAEIIANASLDRSDDFRQSEGDRHVGADYTRPNAGRFRKKPVEIGAMQFNGTREDFDRIMNAFNIPGAEYVSREGEQAAMLIPTLEGTHQASPGDWIIQGVKGEFYPCKPDIFEMTYDVEAVKDYMVGVEDDEG